MKNRLSLLFIGFIGGASINAQTLVSAELINFSSAQILAFVNPLAKYDVNTYKITYNTTNVDGTPTVASGAVMVPVNSGCDQFPLISYSHGTVLERDNVPSRNNTESLIPKILASTGRVATAPDYLGLGDNAGLHPYLHAESEATAAIDLMRAAREFINDSLTATLNGEVFITGYSQGGHGAMAAAKYIQDNSLTNEFNVLAIGPASGPYNLSGTQSELLISDQPYTNPGYVCYLFFGLNRVYNNLYTNYSDILKAPYDQTIPPYFNGNFPMDSVNAQLPAKLSDFIQDSVLTNFKNDSIIRNHPLWQALLQNDNFDWKPDFPVEMYYCTADEQVDYNNSLDAAAKMTANGATNVTAVNRGNLNHGGCVIPSLSGAISFFEAYDTECQLISLQEQLNEGLISLYPNPARDQFMIEGLEDGSATISIYNISGSLIQQESIYSQEGSVQVNIQNIKVGIYLIKVDALQDSFTTKLMVD